MNTIPTSATGIFDMYFNSTDSSTGHSGQDGFSFKYENGTWSDIGVHAPVAFTNTSTYVNQTSVADGEYIYLWASSTECRARFVSPYYEAPAINHNTLITIPSVINSSVSSHTWTFVPGESGQSAGQTYDGSSKLVYSFVSTNRTIKFQAGTWADESTTQAPNQVLYNSANGFVELGDMYAGDQDFGAFTSPFFSSASSTSS